MTTAARPTWYPAAGGNKPRDTGRAPTLQVSSKEVVLEGPLKLRHIPQLETPETDTSKFKELLEQKERESFIKKRGLSEASLDQDIEAKKKLALLNNPDADADAIVGAFDSEDSDSGSVGNESFDSEDDEDTVGDEEEELLRELEKVKKEREEERIASLNAKAKEEEERHEKAMSEGNMLLVPNSQNFGVSRKWYDDTIFKNQARGVRDTPKKRFARIFAPRSMGNIIFLKPANRESPSRGREDEGK